MTKKFLALTLVLVLATGFMAVAAEHGDDRPLYGSWENTLTLNPTPPPGSNIIKAFDSTLDVTYESGGITYTSESVFDLTGYADQTFGVSTSMGLLTLDSTVDFDPSVPALSYWATDASLGLGGVNLSTLFLLQDTDSTSSTHYGAGLKFSLSGETPGGVSVAVDNYFGMDSSTATGSGYVIVTDHDETQTDSYGASSLQYVSTVLTLDSMSLGCCDFSSETKFSEAEGFEYTLFEFTITSETMPLSLAADLKFTPQTKSIHLTPTLETGWACFDVYTSLDANLSRNTNSGSVIDSLIVKGFSITGVELGHVTFSSYTALGTYTVADLNSSLRGSYTYTFVDDEVEDTYTEELDELIRIEKLDKFPLSFTADVYFDMSDSNGLFDLALFELNTAYDLSTQFAVGSGLLISPKNDPYGGLEEVYFSFDYTF
ncbi:MAG: hypothetical protein V5A79_05660 [Candidatus Bipolaricaulota bacterium]